MSVDNEALRLSLQCYQEKNEHFKIVIKELQKEIQSDRIKLEGIGTISKLLQESKQEVAIFKDKSKKCECIIRNLQSRLRAHGISDSVDLGDDEVLLPGTSQQLLENLIRDNKRLRNAAPVSAEEWEKLQMFNDWLQSNVDLLKNECAQKDVRMLQLESYSLSSSNQDTDHKKDAELANLREVVQHLQSESQTQDELCHSLAEETVDLKQQLKDVAIQCEKMAIHLDNKDHARRSPMSTEVTAHVKSKEVPTSEEIMIQQEENAKLKAKLTEVTEMNKRWQDYNTQRDMHVQRLQQQLVDLDLRLTKASTNQIPEVKQQQIQNLLSSAKDKIEQLSLEKAHCEACLKENTALVHHTLGENESLKLQLHELKSSYGGSNVSKDEEIAALKAQVQLCTEDFESERQDREKAQTKIQALEQALVDSQKQIARNKSPQRLGPEWNYRHGNDVLNYGGRPDVHNYRGGQDMMHYRGGQEIPYHHGGQYEKSHLAARGISETVEVDSCSSGKQKSAFSLPAVKDGPPQMLAPPAIPKNKDILTCPRCGKEYTSDNHNELVEHIEICID